MWPSKWDALSHVVETIRRIKGSEYAATEIFESFLKRQKKHYKHVLKKEKLQWVPYLVHIYKNHGH